MSTLSVNDIAQFTYADQRIDVIVKFRLKEQVYLEIQTPVTGLRLPPPQTPIFLQWQWYATHWQQQGIVERIDLGPSPMIVAAMQDQPQAVENRRTRRYHLHIPMLIPQGPLKWRKITTETQDVSVDGLRCQVPMAFTEGTTVDFILELPTRPIKMNGTILRCRESGQPGLFDMALRLNPVMGRDYQLFRAYLDSQP
ncbi:PilZ domain-containing protein [Sulfobacillus thermosulfidooxidans]|uniref:PilZ domain-containing protein n=1 Tax=Sulfobacillus thermosulfidooxidans TaxID=28034 RepID=UPI00096B7051|nr:PilZ domain-containing protein [Sulfobacillus thermosulfidooxidans]OLZ11650.1 hypothetical protein BFX05_06525 [Sulfobacillus thermosulfidooxidans]OLZ18613.1 hypothetical protein BFX06_00120 [Sulfobacillus thermosulfidooxidans]OLZ20308.1 hypothetical protein BFX07_01680 [Sulfobacillus thermosulfidooxidans]